jgi:hypothetical protein
MAFKMDSTHHSLDYKMPTAGILSFHTLKFSSSISVQISVILEGNEPSQSILNISVVEP